MLTSSFMPMPNTAALRRECDKRGYAIPPGPTWYDEERRVWVVNVLVLAEPGVGYRRSRVITAQESIKSRKSIAKIADKFREIASAEILEEILARDRKQAIS